MISIDNIKLIQGDCLEKMNDIKDKSIDMIFADLPFGTTNCRWDIIIPLNDFINIDNKNYTKDEFYLNHIKKYKAINIEELEAIWRVKHKKGLWSHYNRIIKDNGAILLFSQTPFDKVLGNSNISMLKYEWIWEKTQATGHLNAKKMPMKAHENILVFYKKLPTYNPQKTYGHKPTNTYTKYVATQNKTDIYGKVSKEISGGKNTDRFPRSVQIFSSDKQKSHLHPTQKPLDLLEYLIKTYTNEGETVLDNCMGSGSTGVACINTNRKFIGIEKDDTYFNVSQERIDNTYNELKNIV